MPNKLTDEQIKKALECCSQSGDFTKTQDEICSPCPYSNCGDCTGLLKANALDLINRQTIRLRKVEHQLDDALKMGEVINAENVSLKAEVERLLKKTPRPQDADPMDFCGVLCDFAEGIIAKTKAEAYKECIEKVEQIICDNTYPDFDINHKAVNVWKAEAFKKINNLLNELVGENK